MTKEACDTPRDGVVEGRMLDERLARMREVLPFGLWWDDRMPGVGVMAAPHTTGGEMTAEIAELIHELPNALLAERAEVTRLTASLTALGGVVEKADALAEGADGIDELSVKEIEEGYFPGRSELSTALDAYREARSRITPKGGAA